MSRTGSPDLYVYFMFVLAFNYNFQEITRNPK